MILFIYKSMKTAVRIISLRSSLERRSSISAQQGIESLNWDFFDALTDTSVLLKYDKLHAIRSFGRALTRSELGCYSSHYMVWDWFLKSRFDQVFVFEDDVIVDWEIIKRLSYFDFQGHNFNLIRLSSIYPLPFKVVHYNFAHQYYHLIQVKGRHLGAAGYVLTRLGAEILISKCKKVIYPLDWAIHRYWITNLPNFVIFPFPLTLRTQPSTIGDNNSRDIFEPLILKDFFFFWSFKVVERIRRAIFDFLHFFRKTPINSKSGLSFINS